MLTAIARCDRWVERLVDLAEAGSPEFSKPARLANPGPGECWWQDKERALFPPADYLVELLTRIPARPRGSKESDVKRAKLFDGDIDTLQEAERRIRDGERGRKWFILEGQSYPDACVETSGYVLVIEGKRTESGSTKRTSWAANRHQILRYLDGAFEIADGRPLIGLMAVEGNLDGSVPAKWIDASREVVEGETVADSLPHRSGAERRMIAAAFAGVTTWQKIAVSFGMDPQSLPSTIGDVAAWEVAQVGRAE